MISDLLLPDKAHRRGAGIAENSFLKKKLCVLCVPALRIASRYFLSVPVFNK
jgi:hypothetical protein